MSTTGAEAHHLRDLARLRRVRDRMDREYAQPLNVEALARGVNMSGRHLSREFKRADGETPYAHLMTRGHGALMLTTKDLDATFAPLQAGDAEVVQEPTEQPWSSRNCAFRDPAGNMIRIQETR